METIFDGLNNAYILFCILVGAYAVLLAVQDKSLSGNFFGAVAVNSGLAAAILLVALVMTAMGDRPYGTAADGSGDAQRNIYYLYAIYFVISLPGVFTLSRGNDGRIAFIYAGVAFFNAAAAYRAVTLLAETWK
jgi:Na+/melibiose symporter-like transporter